YQDGIRQTATRLGIADRVQFLGWQPDVRAVLAAADIYCQPNTGPEPFGIAIIEALFAGLPAVATNLGGPGEILDSSCGILVPSGDVPGLARALERLIREPAQRRQLGAAGPARARVLCDPATQLARLAGVLARVEPTRLAEAVGGRAGGAA